MSTKRRANGEGSAPVQRRDGSWQVNIGYTDRDGMRKRTSVYGKTAGEVREKAKAIRKRLEGGLPARDARNTLADYTHEWIRSTLAASERKATTKTLYEMIARKHIASSQLGSRTLDKLRASHVEAWVVELRDRNLAPATVRQAYTILRAVLDSAVRDEALAKNPAALVARPRLEHREAAFLTPAQVRLLLDASERNPFRHVFELLLHTGLRRGEALALKWTDIDFEARTIRVRGTLSWIDSKLVVTEPKTEKSRRVIHMTDASARILRAAKASQAEARLRVGRAWQDTGFVFTTEIGTPRDPRGALRALKTAAKSAGLPASVGLHTLRHSAASTMLAAGVPLKVVSDVLGHSSVSITGDIYGHVAPEVAADALAKLETAFA